MKKILFPLLVLFPLGVFAQDANSDSSAAKVMKWEAGLNTILAFSPDDDVIYDDVFLAGRNALSIYRNFSNAQVGLLVEGGLMDAGENWWISPQAVVNYKIPFRKLYAYGGGVAGYVREQRPNRLYGISMNGFVAGAQAGAVYNLGKRFGLNVEAGARFKHVSATLRVVHENGTGGGTFTTEETIGHTSMYLPLSVGVRYKF